MEQHSAIYHGTDSCDFRLPSTGSYLPSQNQRRSLIVQLSIKIAALVAIGFTTTTAYAAIVYSQATPEEPFAAFASNDSFTTSQRVADNFSLPGSSPVEIRSLRFIGGAEPQPDEFRVVFLEDAGGSPGVPLAGGDFSIGSAFNRTPTGGRLLNGVTTPLEYVINIPGGILLDANRPYWVSITNDLLPASGWAWARAEGEFDQNLASTFDIASGPWATSNSGGMWFELSDQRIPESSSLMLLLIAAALIMPIRNGSCVHRNLVFR